MLERKAKKNQINIKKFGLNSGSNMRSIKTMINKIEEPIKEFPSIEISDDKKQKYFKNIPFYNFMHAEEELGFSFSDFAKNNFAEFLNTCYVEDFINLRKNFIMRNYVAVRFLAHKFKSPFGLFCCDIVKDSCENLQSAIDKGNFDLEDLYIEVLISLNQFLNKLLELCNNLNLSLHSEFTKKFIEYNEKCNKLEDYRIKSKICPDFDSMLLGNKDQRIILDSRSRSICCNDRCIII